MVKNMYSASQFRKKIASILNNLNDNEVLELILKQINLVTFQSLVTVTVTCNASRFSAYLV